MARGEESLRLELARRRAQTPEQRAWDPPPPGPTSRAAPAVGSVLLALTIAGIVVLAKRWMKLADVAHLKDDAERERRLREAIYGRLELEENK